MTVHKAKGLGFPVVIVLLYGAASRGFDYILDREGEEVVLLKLSQKVIASAPQFKGRYDEEVLKETVNRLNSLYVGFTRAREELYVIGVRGKRDARLFDLLPSREYPPAAKPVRTFDAESDEEGTTPLYHAREPSGISTGPYEQERLSFEERRRGELIHHVFSSIEWVGEDFEARLARAIREAPDEMCTGYDSQELKKIVGKMIEHPEVRGSFVPGPEREVRREQEFVDGEGRLFRMDRVVIDQDRVTMIDWKTGKDRGNEKNYEGQMRNYLKILREVYPGRKAEGFLAYVDLQEVKRIG